MKTRTSALLSILLWGVVLVVAVLLFISLTNHQGFSIFSLFDNFSGERRIIQELEIDQTIDRIEIDWTAGGVTLTRSNDDTIYFKESATADLAPDKWAVYTVSNGKLSIESKNRQEFNFLFLFRSPVSYLELAIPDALYESVKLQLTSGNYDIKDLDTKTLEIQAISGNLKLSNITAEDIIIKLTSGNVDVRELTAENMDFTMTSGNATFKGSITNDYTHKMTSGKLVADLLGQAPSSMRVDVTSGLVEIDLDQTDGFEALVSKVAGSFTADFSHTQNNDRYIHKNGEARYDFKITSGSITLRVNP